MATSRLGRVIQALRTASLPHEGAGLSDGQLLECYVRSREEAAFAALVQRHGPMVWGVCRRVLRNHQDAEDAFQATFLVLVRKAAAVAPREMVANWLYGVAHLTALRARAATARRSAREKQVTAMPEPAVERPQPRDDLQPLLDQELSRLPDKYRAVIVLCDLEGKTRKEVARQLHVPEGTVASRLATARRMLAKRLARCGLAVSGAALAAVLAQQAASASVPVAVASSTIKAGSLLAAGQTTAPGVISVRALALADGVLKAMLLTRLKTAAAVLVLLAVLGAGAIALTQHAPAGTPADQPRTESQQPVDQPVKEKNEGAWPQWRGPNRDGVVHGVTVPARWPRTLTEEWRVPVGEGVASPVVAGGRVYVFTRLKEGEETLLCLDLASGQENWRSAYPAPYRLGGPAHGYEGPRSTPAVAGGRVFTFGTSGILSCLDARTGDVLWRKDFARQYPGTAPGWGTAASPLVDGDLCIIHVGGPDRGGLTAFDVKTGEARWCYDGDGPAYGSPILADLAGERQVVTLTLNYFLGVSATTGKLLWKLPCREIHSENCVTPVLSRDLLIYAGRSEPPRAIRLEKGEKGLTPKDVWKGDGPTLYLSSPVLAGDLLFGTSSRGRGCFFCLDAKNGKTLWESDERQGVGYTTLLSAGSVLLFLTQDGRLVVVKPGGKGYEPIAEYKVSDRRTMAHPVFLGDRILVRDDSTLRSYRIEAGARE